MTEIKHTPSEYFEAQDKFNQHEKGREQAKFYKHFIGKVRSEVVRQILRKDLNKELGDVDINKTDLPLKKFEFCDASNIQGYIEKARKEANQFAGTNESTTTNAQELAEMTPIDFYNYMNNLEKKLIQD